MVEKCNAVQIRLRHPVWILINYNECVTSKLHWFLFCLIKNKFENYILIPLESTEIIINTLLLKIFLVLNRKVQTVFKFVNLINTVINLNSTNMPTLKFII